MTSIMILCLFLGFGVNVAKTTAITTGELAARGVAVGVGVVFTVIDIALLVKDWDKKHPVVENLEQLSDELNNYLGSIDVIIKALKECLIDGYYDCS